MFPLLLNFFGDAVKDGILGVFLLIDSVIYWAVSKLYGLFIDIASARIFSSEVISDVGNRLYGLIGVIMLFVVAYSLLTAIIDPNKMSKGEMSSGKLAKNTIISIIIIAVLPTVFNFMYKVQDVIMTENVFGKIIFGDPDDGKVDSVTITVDLSQISEEERNDAINMFKMEEDPSTGYYTYTQPATSLQAKKYGNKMAFGVLHAFLNPDDVDVKVKATESGTAEKVHTVSKGAAVVTCAAGAVGAVSLTIISALPAFTTLPAGLTAASIIMGVSCNGAIQAAAASKAVIYVSGQETKWSELSKHVEESGDFMELARLSKPIVEGEIDYMPVASTICGAVLLYVILSFCLDLGVRAVKLAFYQLIAPLPIMLRIVPKQEKMFNNWLKCTLSTYFEVFVRLIVIYIITYLASKIFASDTFVFEQLGMFGKAIVVMGLVAFAKQAPKLIGEVTGIKSDGLKLGIRDKLAAGGAFTAGAILGGGITAATRNGFNAYRNTEGGKGQKIAALFRSGAGGFISGGIRGGKAGKGAKSWGDMVGASTKGAEGAIKARNRRQDRKDRYQALYGAPKADTGNKIKDKFIDAANAIKTPIMGRKADIKDSMMDWATGGAAQYESAIKVGKKYNEKSDAIKAQTNEIIKKYGDEKALVDQSLAGVQEFSYDDKTGALLGAVMKDGSLVNLDASGKIIDALDATGVKIEDAGIEELQEELNTSLKKWKGSSATRFALAQEFKKLQEYNGGEVSLNQVTEYINRLNTPVDREQFKSQVQTKNADGTITTKVVFDQAAFDKAEKARSDEIILLNNMAEQLKKQAGGFIIDASVDAANRNADGTFINKSTITINGQDNVEIKCTDLAGTGYAVEAFQNAFKMDGASITDSTTGVTTEGIIEEKKDASGKVISTVSSQIKDITDAATNNANAAKRQADAYEEAKAKRSGGDKK